MAQKQEHATAIAAGALAMAALRCSGAHPEKTTTVSAAATRDKKRPASQATFEQEE